VLYGSPVNEACFGNKVILTLVHKCLDTDVHRRLSLAATHSV
jgi:hypothetical protein